MMAGSMLSPSCPANPGARDRNFIILIVQADNYKIFSIFNILYGRMMYFSSSPSRLRMSAFLAP
jgi:hypothetical protein